MMVANGDTVSNSIEMSQCLKDRWKRRFLLFEWRRCCQSAALLQENRHQFTARSFTVLGSGSEGGRSLWSHLVFSVRTTFKHSLLTIAFPTFKHLLKIVPVPEVGIVALTKTQQDYSISFSIIAENKMWQKCFDTNMTCQLFSRIILTNAT